MRTGNSLPMRWRYQVRQGADDACGQSGDLAPQCIHQRGTVVVAVPAIEASD